MRVAVWMCVFACLASPAAAQRLALRFTDGRTAPSLVLEQADPGTDELYVAANDLCAALDLQRYWRPELRKLVLVVGERRIQVTVDARLVLDGDAEVLLRSPIRYRRNSVLLPLEFIERVLGPAVGRGSRLDRDGLELVLGPGDTDVLAVVCRPVADGTEVRVQLARALRHVVQKTSDETVRLVLEGGKVDPLALAADAPAPQIRSIRAEQGPRDARLYLEVVPPVAGVASRTEDDGRTIVLDLLRGREVVDTQPGWVRPLVAVPPAATDSFDLVALDPGHGGFDRGVVAHGQVEKDLTLQLARRLQPVLEQQLGVRVLLLRSGDETLGAETRDEIANRAGADVLLSLHANAWFDDAARGYGVLYPASTAAAAGAAAASAGMADFWPWRAAHVPYLERSAALAEIVREELERGLDGPSRGAHPAALDVLLGAAMPAVAIEVGFLTDAEEAAAVASEEFAGRLASALVAALGRYRDRPQEEARP